MNKLILGIAITLPLALAVPASATPAGPSHISPMRAAVGGNVIEVKGGHGFGHGWGHAHSSRPFGWSRGRKVGWRGRGCPPGLWKKGWC